MTRAWTGSGNGATWYQPRIADTLTLQLKTLMPVMQSCQDRGLWARFASCTMYSGDDYYSRAIKLATSVAGTQLNGKIAAAVGTTAKLSDLLEAFKADFGDEKLNAVDFVCRKIGKDYASPAGADLADDAGA